MKFFRSIAVVLILALATSPALAAVCATSCASQAIMSSMHPDNMSGMKNCHEASMNKDKNKAAVKGVDKQGRPVRTGAGAIQETVQSTKNPTSAQAPRAEQGKQGNQPWYTGALIAGGPALGNVASSIASAFKNRRVTASSSDTFDDSSKEYDDNNIVADESDYGKFNQEAFSESDNFYNDSSDQDLVQDDSDEWS